MGNNVLEKCIHQQPFEKPDVIMRKRNLVSRTIKQHKTCILFKSAVIFVNFRDWLRSSIETLDRKQTHSTSNYIISHFIQYNRLYNFCIVATNKISLDEIGWGVKISLQNWRCPTTVQNIWFLIVKSGQAYFWGQTMWYKNYILHSISGLFSFDTTPSKFDPCTLRECTGNNGEDCKYKYFSL